MTKEETPNIYEMYYMWENVTTKYGNLNVCFLNPSSHFTSFGSTKVNIQSNKSMNHV